MPPTYRYELAVAPEERDRASARLWVAGALGVWEQPERLVAWFAADVAADDLVLPPPIDGGRWSVEPDRDWQAEWKATIRPAHAGRFAVVPTWLAEDHRRAEEETTLVLDPGRAFGSGHHATTTLCLEELDRRELAGHTVVDVGCGSGILAIAAATRGARVVGTDLDPDAVTVSEGNAARNGVSVRFARGSADEAVELLGGPADLVVANLVTDTLVALAEALVAATAPGGDLVVSGIAQERGERVATALHSAGLRDVSSRGRDGWVALTGHRPAGPGGAAGGSSATLRG